MDIVADSNYNIQFRQVHARVFNGSKADIGTMCVYDHKLCKLSCADCKLENLPPFSFPHGLIASNVHGWKISSRLSTGKT